MHGDIRVQLIFQLVTFLIYPISIMAVVSACSLCYLLMLVILNLYLPVYVPFSVSGDANFSMHHTGMTISGFIQPNVARSLIELQSNVEKSLCQHFLWLCPKVTFVKFDQLQEIDENFSTAIC